MRWTQKYLIQINKHSKSRSRSIKSLLESLKMKIFTVFWRKNRSERQNSHSSHFRSVHSSLNKNCFIFVCSDEINCLDIGAAVGKGSHSLSMCNSTSNVTWSIGTSSTAVLMASTQQTTHASHMSFIIDMWCIGISDNPGIGSGALGSMSCPCMQSCASTNRKNVTHSFY